MTAPGEAATPSALIPLRAMDPAVTLAATLLFAVLVSFLTSPVTAACACLGPLLLVPAAGLRLQALLRRLAPINFFFLFLWVFLPLSLDRSAADTVITAGPFVLRSSGVLLALAVTLKGNAIALALLILLESSSMSALGHALKRLRVPAKLVTLMLLTYSNIQLLRIQATRLQQAALLRGHAAVNSLRAYRTAAYLAAMLLIRAWERAERVNTAMRLRGFCGVFPLPEPTEYTPEFRIRSFALLAASCGFSLLLVLADRI